MHGSLQQTTVGMSAGSLPLVLLVGAQFAFSLGGKRVK